LLPNSQAQRLAHCAQPASPRNLNMSNSAVRRQGIINLLKAKLVGVRGYSQPLAIQVRDRC
jgi:hypothetical protein